MRTSVVPKSTPLRSNVLTLLRTFSPDEHNSFGKFLGSQQSAGSSLLSRLYTGMSRYYPDYNSAELQPKKIFSRACPGKRFDSVTYRKYMSMLFKKAEEFLCTRQSRAEGIRSNIKLLVDYRKRGLKGLYSKKLKEVESDLKATEIGDYDLDLLRHELEVEKYYYLTEDNQLKDSLEVLDRSGWHLLKYFVSFATVSRYMFYELNYNLKLDPDSKFPETFFRTFDFKNYLDKFETAKSSVNEFERLEYQLINFDLKLFENPDSTENYFSLRNFLNKHKDSLSASHKIFYYTKLIAYCLRMRRLSRPGPDYNKEIFELYCVLIESGLIFGCEEPTVKYNDFRNLIDAALKSGNRKWVAGFLESMKSKIRSESFHEIIEMGRARLFYEDNDVSRCMETLASIRPISETMGLDLYALKFYCLFELDHTNSAMSLLDTFRHHVSYNRHISPQYAESARRFINYSKKLLRLRKKPSIIKLNILLEEISGDSVVYSQRWLLEKINALTDQTEKSQAGIAVKKG